MRAWKRVGILILAGALLALGGAAYAGGPDCHGKSEAAKAGKHDCNMTAEECAKEMQKAMATRGWLGIDLDLSQVTITKVHADSPAAQAGFQVGDRIVSINGMEVNVDSKGKLHDMLKGAKIGDPVRYVVVRGSENLTLEATLAKIPQSVLSESIDRHAKEDHPMVKN